MTRLLSVRVGLWIRMGVACGFAIIGQSVLLLVEFVLVSGMMLVLMIGAEALLAVALLFSLISVVAVICWRILAGILRRLLPTGVVVNRVAHDGLANALERAGRTVLTPTNVVNTYKLGVVLVAVVIAIVLVEAIPWRDILTPLQAAAAIGMLGVGAHLAWVVYTEWTNETAVLGAIETSADVAAAPAVDRVPVQTRVDRLAQQAGLPSPTVRIGAATTPIAATVGYRPSTSTIVISQGLLELLPDSELDAVLAHELAHLANRDAAVVTALSVPKAYAIAVLARYDGYPIITVPAGLVFVGIHWCIAIVGRYREYLADDGAVAITGDPAALGSALETLDRDLERRPATDLRDHRSAATFAIVPPPWEEHRFFDRTRRVVARKLFGTHPPTEKRIERLRTATDGR